jgi:cyclopropane-fatty-acyl-phospholipid synthase
VEAGLADRCRIECCDYRELDEPEGFDKLVSLGMFEHVAPDALEGYFRHARRQLKPGGVFLAHGIASSPTAPPRSGPTFLDSYVFPDHGVVPVSTMLTAAERAGFEPRDLESLREHYALTLRRWRERLEANRDEGVRVTDEAVYRIWRLMFAGSAYRFDKGHANVYQALLGRPDAHGVTRVPLSRADWYV